MGPACVSTFTNINVECEIWTFILIHFTVDLIWQKFGKFNPYLYDRQIYEPSIQYDCRMWNLISQQMYIEQSLSTGDGR